MNDYELLLPYFEKKYGNLAIDNAKDLLIAIGKIRVDKAGVSFYDDLSRLVMMGGNETQCTRRRGGPLVADES